VVIKGLKFIMSVKSVVIIYIINLQYILIVKVVNVNYGCYNYRVWDGRSGTLFLLFFHLPPGLLFLLNFFLKLR